MRCRPFLHLNKQTLDHNRGLQRRLLPEFGQPNKTGESKTAYSRLSFSIGIEYDPKLLKNCNNQISDGKQKGSQWLPFLRYAIYFLNVFGSGIFRRPNVARIPTCPLLAFTHCLDGTVSLMIVIRMRRTQQSHQYSKKYTIHNSKILLEKLGRSPRIHPRGLLQFFRRPSELLGSVRFGRGSYQLLPNRLTASAASSRFEICLVPLFVD